MPFKKAKQFMVKIQRIWPSAYMLGLRFHPTNERTSFKLPSNCKAWSTFPRTKLFSPTMLKNDGWQKFLERWEVSKEYFLEYLPKQKVLKRVLLITKDTNKFKRYSKEKTALPSWLMLSFHSRSFWLLSSLKVLWFTSYLSNSKVCWNRLCWDLLISRS